MKDLRDKVAVVTGGASGIGRGLCRALAAEGAHVVVADVEAEAAEQVAKELAGRGVRSLAVACDVADRAAVEALADRAWQEFGHVEVLCNNAGVGQMGPVAAATWEDVQWVFSVNVFGVWNGCSVFVPRFQAGGSRTHDTRAWSQNAACFPYAQSVLGILTQRIQGIDHGWI